MADQNSSKDRWQRLKFNLVRRVLPLAIVAFLLWVTTVLTGTAAKDEDSLKSPAALLFEKESATWFAHPMDSSHFLKLVNTGDVQAVAVSSISTDGQIALYTDKAGSRYSATLVPCGSRTVRCSTDIATRLGDLSVKYGFVLATISVDSSSVSQKVMQGIGSLFSFLLALFPVILMIGFFVIQMKGGLKSKATLAKRPETRFDDVIGVESAKKSLRRVAAFMNDPAAYVALGSRVPRGVLLEGPPGTGKTLLAKALAGECGVNFISVDGAYFSSMFFGSGITKVKELFKRARECAPAIIFIDEIDGIGSRSTGRVEGSGGGEQEQNRIINRILVEMDGFGGLENVVIIGATNNIENIDPAMRRPGRFDFSVKLELPTETQRGEIFALYSKKVKTDATADREGLMGLGKMSVGMSPADIANAVNVAAAYAAEAGEKSVGIHRFVQAVETQQMGGEVTSTNDIITPETRRRLGVHEGGHGLVAHFLNAGSVSHMSIESRDKSLGATYVVRHTEEPLYGESELHARLAMMLAGREAELLIYGNTSTGAGDDLKRSSELAISMIGSMGMGQTIGLLSLAGVPKELLGPDIQRQVLEEAREILESARAECRRVLTENKGRLELLASLLVEHGTLTGDALQDVFIDITPVVPEPTLPMVEFVAEAAL